MPFYSGKGSGGDGGSGGGLPSGSQVFTTDEKAKLAALDPGAINQGITDANQQAGQAETKADSAIATAQAAAQSASNADDKADAALGRPTFQPDEASLSNTGDFTFTDNDNCVAFNTSNGVRRSDLKIN